jgi:hypothetical protein
MAKKFLAASRFCSVQGRNPLTLSEKLHNLLVRHLLTKSGGQVVVNAAGKCEYTRLNLGGEFGPGSNRIKEYCRKSLKSSRKRSGAPWETILELWEQS